VTALVDQLRADTPAAADVLHLDHAGSSLPPKIVTDAVVAHLHAEARLGGYRAAREAQPALEAFYTEAATALNTGPESIAFFESATAAWQAVVAALRLKAGDRVLLHRTTYASNALAFLQLERRGVVLDWLDSTPTGEIDLDALATALERPAQLVALTHIPTGSGLVQPAEAVGALARAAGVPFLLDACQSLGQVPLDLPALGCDFLSATGRKYARGPRGTGLLAIRPDRIAALEPAPIDLYGGTWLGGTAWEMRPDARRFECFERNFAGQIGFGVALAYGNRIGWDRISERTFALGAALRARLRALDGVRVVDDGARQGGIVTFTADAASPGALQALQSRMADDAIHVSVSNATSSAAHHAARGISAALRASVHAVNTEDELDRFTDWLRRR
jgi:selenocysteine lyase/cysteine desulfurase